MKKKRTSTENIPKKGSGEANFLASLMKKKSTNVVSPDEQTVIRQQGVANQIIQSMEAVIADADFLVKEALEIARNGVYERYLNDSAPDVRAVRLYADIIRPGLRGKMATNPNLVCVDYEKYRQNLTDLDAYKKNVDVGVKTEHEKPLKSYKDLVEHWRKKVDEPGYAAFAGMVISNLLAPAIGLSQYSPSFYMKAHVRVREAILSVVPKDSFEPDYRYQSETVFDLAALQSIFYKKYDRSAVMSTADIRRFRMAWARVVVYNGSVVDVINEAIAIFNEVKAESKARIIAVRELMETQALENHPITEEDLNNPNGDKSPKS